MNLGELLNMGFGDALMIECGCRLYFDLSIELVVSIDISPFDSLRPHVSMASYYESS